MVKTATRTAGHGQAVAQRVVPGVLVERREFLRPPQPGHHGREAVDDVGDDGEDGGQGAADRGVPGGRAGGKCQGAEDEGEQRHVGHGGDDSAGRQCHAREVPFAEQRDGGYGAEHRRCPRSWRRISPARCGCG